MGVVVAGTRVLAGGIGVAVSGMRVGAVGVACAGVGSRAQAVAARTNPIATSKDPSLFLLIEEPPFMWWESLTTAVLPSAQEAALSILYHISLGLATV